MCHEFYLEISFWAWAAVLFSFPGDAAPEECGEKIRGWGLTPGLSSFRAQRSISLCYLTLPKVTSISLWVEDKGLWIYFRCPSYWWIKKKILLGLNKEAKRGYWQAGNLSLQCKEVQSALLLFKNWFALFWIILVPSFWSPLMALDI